MVKAKDLLSDRDGTGMNFELVRHSKYQRSILYLHDYIVGWEPLVFVVFTADNQVILPSAAW